MAPATEREVAALCAELGVAMVPPRTGTGIGYRKRSRLAVRGSSRRPRLGIYEQGSHDVVDIERCRVHDPLINDVARQVAAAVVATRTPVYVEARHVGLLRYLQVVVERATRKAQLVLVVNADDAASCLPLLNEVERRLGDRLQGLFVNLQSERGNRILGSRWVQHAGQATTHERIGGADVFFPPGAFGQANLDLFDQIVDQVHAWVDSDGPLVELFCGVGAMGLGLARRGMQVTFNEVSEHGLEGLRLGIEALESASSNVSVLPGAAERAIGQLEMDGATLLVDPPRKGLAPQLLQAVVQRPPRQLIYVSCGLSSFQRDARGLAAAGFRCLELHSYAAFPFTEHVETISRWLPG